MINQLTKGITTVRWKPDCLYENLLGYSLKNRDKALRLLKQVYAYCVEHDSMRSFSKFLKGLPSSGLNKSLIVSILLKYRHLHGSCQIKIQKDGKTSQICVLDYLWLDLANKIDPVMDLEPDHDIHPTSMINLVKLNRKLIENWPTSRRMSFTNFSKTLENSLLDSDSLRFIYCKYYSKRLRPKSLLIYFEASGCTYLYGRKTLKYRLKSHCGKYVVYSNSRLKYNSYIELFLDRPFNLVKKEDIENHGNYIWLEGQKEK